MKFYIIAILVSTFSTISNAQVSFHITYPAVFSSWTSGAQDNITWVGNCANMGANASSVRFSILRTEGSMTIFTELGTLDCSINKSLRSIVVPAVPSAYYKIQIDSQPPIQSDPFHIEGTNGPYSVTFSTSISPPSPTAPTIPATTGSDTADDSTKRIAIIAGTSGVGIILIGVVVLFIIRYKTKRRRSRKREKSLLKKKKALSSSSFATWDAKEEHNGDIISGKLEMVDPRRNPQGQREYVSSAVARGPQFIPEGESESLFLDLHELGLSSHPRPNVAITGNNPHTESSYIYEAIKTDELKLKSNPMKRTMNEEGIELTSKSNRAKLAFNNKL
ncbi:hypothetical protein BGZ76_004152 [Entomortierella beljakovae]|nr:hypothetical protein BGZ76_004152 [Entomortierella beljakovae]